MTPIEGTEENPLTIVEENNPSPLALMPVMNIEEADQRRKAIVEFTKALMVEGTDYGKVPGTKRNTLLKPGAEKLTTHFGLTPRFPIMKETLDWIGDDHGGEPFFYFQYMCQLFKGDYLVGEGVGSCNSWEKKYRFRKGARVCPQCNAEAIIKGKQEYGGGWLCFHRMGGCGQKWEDGAKEIEEQSVGQVLNDSPQDLVNTIDKMAQKRALIAATLIAVNASEFFTQDLENGEIINGEITDPVVRSEAPKTPSATRAEFQWETNVVDKIVDLGLANARQHAIAILEQSPFKALPFGQLELIEAVAYFIGRAVLKEELPDVDSKGRAAMANDAWAKGNNEAWLDKATVMLNAGEGKEQS